jgi:pilus assembly protein Flp/PilA
MRNLAKRFVSDGSGAAAVEYGLIAACIAIAIVAVVRGIAASLSSTFNSIPASLH